MITKTAGDAQSQTISTGLAERLTVRVTSSDGRPVPGVTVQWSVAAGGGRLSAATSTTDASGNASIQWEMGPKAGNALVTATVVGIAPAEFTARATAFYTLLVYMAADNTLSWAGVDDIDEMEKVGSSDSVQVVVQAEFSPSATRLEGCTPGCFNRPNYNTFRYRAERGAARRGPDGAVLDIGNRDMTQAAELADFVAWAKQNYPAQKYALVLWNHGGGYTGLIEDVTSAGNSLMSLTALRDGLQRSATRFAMIDFDMCLMGAAETLVTVNGYADHVVFSEESEPGEGNPYDRTLAKLRANPGQAASALAVASVDDFVDSYASGRNAVTKSAVDMSRFDGFMGAWDALAVELRDNLATHGTALSQVAEGTQSYDMEQLRDLGDLLVRLRAATSSAVLQQKIDAVRAQLTGGLITKNRFRSNRDANLDRSTGLHVLLPSGGASDRLATTGPSSFASYKATYPASAWTGFLERWLQPAAQTTYFDQGANQLQAALAWDSKAVAAGADVDFWVLEPSGELYIPYLGVVTPNGTFSGDSQETDSYYEIYTSRRFVQVGRYEFFAELWSDPQNFRPRTTMLYRNNSSAEWTDLYGDAPLTLSTDRKWTADAAASYEKIRANAYTDLRYVAYWDVKAAASANRTPGGQGSGARLNAARTGSGPSLSRAQMERVSRLMRDPKIRLQRERAHARARAQRGELAPADLVRAARGAFEARP